MWKSTFVNSFCPLFLQRGQVILKLGGRKKKMGNSFILGGGHGKREEERKKKSTYLRNTNLNIITWCTKETLKIAEKTALLKTASWDRTWSKINAINQQHEWILEIFVGSLTTLITQHEAMQGECPELLGGQEAKCCLNFFSGGPLSWALLGSSFFFFREWQDFRDVSKRRSLAQKFCIA